MTLEIITADTADFDRRANIPAMLSDDEKALYRQVASTYTGIGSVIEIGSWLGAGTYQICSGLAESGFNTRVTVFDRFRWSPIYANSYPTIPVGQNESFLRIFEQNLEPFEGMIDVVVGELSSIETLLPMKSNIELLFIDAPKSWRLLWKVLNHVGPRLLPGARVVLQDYLHITSRQIAWLTGSIPGLTMTQTVETGTSVTFIASGPLTALEEIVPRDIEAIPTKDLIACGRRLWKFLPAERAAWLGTGLALDLLDRGELDEACAVLDEVVVCYPETQQAVLDELSRLTRKAAPGVRTRLLEVVGYLRARVRPGEVRLAAPPAREKRAATPSPLDGMDRDEARRLGQAMLTPLSPTALATRYVMSNGMPEEPTFRRLFGALDGCVQLGAAAAMLELGLDPAAATVVEIGGGPTLNGLVLRCLGAERYIGVVGVDNPELRTYRNPATGAKWRASLTLSELTTLVPGFSFAPDSAALADGSADIVLLHPPVNSLDEALAEAARLLRPGGKLVLFWRNPRSWSGHGRAPQTVDAIDLDDTAQQTLVDWQHLSGIRRSVPTLAEVEDLLSAAFLTSRIVRQMDDPNVIMRLSNRLFRSHPRLKPADFVYRSITLIAERMAAVAKSRAA